MTRRFQQIASAAVLLVAGVIGYQWLRANLEADIYRQRLGELSQHYQDLRRTYNEAVRRTAITELVVADGHVSVSIRTAEGEIKRIDTPYVAGSEVFVDYVVLDGRLWIRRVFDSDTPPRGGVMIDPKLADVKWDDNDLVQGKAVYRRLDEGRWIVTVTGNGALGLARREGDSEELSAPPPLRDYEPTVDQADADVQRIGTMDVLKRMAGAER
ncbi:MAG: hypothetical protein IT445_05045 [Phycisphaeraceae bacterium]|nr:hypothetical protein [Phycisphaeraceae bacterium]